MRECMNPITSDDRCRLNIIKGILIILMVYGHTFGVGRDFVYLFHIPVFFMVSGYCWNNKHALDRTSFLDYSYNRAIRLMLPYYVCNVTFILLHNIFIEVGVYTDNPEILEIQDLPIEQFVAGHLSLKSMIPYVYHALCNEGGGQLTGATWFLYTLFCVCISHCFAEYLISKCHNRKVKEIIWIGILGILISISWVASEGKLDSFAYNRHLKLPAAYLLYLIGVKLRRLSVFNTWKQHHIFYCASAGIVLCLLSKIGTIELSMYRIINPAFLILTSISGWVLLNSLGDLFVGKTAGAVLSYIGKNTLPILMLHMISFKIVSYIIVQIKGIPFYLVALYTIIFDTSEWEKILYTIVGCSVPIALSLGFKRLIRLLTRSTNKVQNNRW